MSLTEKGKIALENILINYSPNEIFTASDLSKKTDLSVHAATLNSLVKEGYLLKYDQCTPKKYEIVLNAQDIYDIRKPKTFGKYSVEEMEKQKLMSYFELCEYLVQKYGIVDGNYFNTPEMKSKNRKISRGKEGLSIHHIKENTKIMLSHPDYAIKAPFEFQEGKNLVYCNIIEHLLLHCKIVLEEFHPYTHEELVGIGGIVNFLIPQIALKFTTSSSVESIDIDNFIILITDFFSSYEESIMFPFCVNAKEICIKKTECNFKIQQALIYSPKKKKIKKTKCTPEDFFSGRMLAQTVQFKKALITKEVKEKMKILGYDYIPVVNLFKKKEKNKWKKP